MAFTYHGPSGGDRDLLRFVVGDTQALRHLLEDDELDYLLGVWGGVDQAVIPALDRMLAVASQAVDWGSGQERESAGQRVAALRRMRADLVAQGYQDPAPTQGVSRVRTFGRPPADATDYTARTTDD